MGNKASKDFAKIGKVITTPIKVVTDAADTARTVSTIPLSVAKSAKETTTAVASVAPKVVNFVGSKDTWDAVGDAGKGVIGAGVSVVKETGGVAKGLISGTGNFLTNAGYVVLAVVGIGGVAYVVTKVKEKD